MPSNDKNRWQLSYLRHHQSRCFDDYQTTVLWMAYFGPRRRESSDSRFQYSLLCSLRTLNYKFAVLVILDAAASFSVSAFFHYFSNSCYSFAGIDRAFIGLHHDVSMISICFDRQDGHARQTACQASQFRSWGCHAYSNPPIGYGCLERPKSYSFGSCYPNCTGWRLGFANSSSHFFSLGLNYWGLCCY